jgi:hypothetical protein
MPAATAAELVQARTGHTRAFGRVTLRHRRNAPLEHGRRLLFASREIVFENRQGSFELRQQIFRRRAVAAGGAHFGDDPALAGDDDPATMHMLLGKKMRGRLCGHWRAP